MNICRGLFGYPVDMEIHRKPKSQYQEFKVMNGYSIHSQNKCRDCKHLYIMNYHDKKYFKCQLMGISHSEATDIRLSYGCKKFEKKGE